MATKPSKPTSESDSSTQTPDLDTTTAILDGEITATTIETLPDTSSEQGNESGTVVPTGEAVSRTSVVFITAYHRYVRGDQATFDDEYSRELVEKRCVAVWPKDAKKALSSRPGEFENDLDIG